MKIKTINALMKYMRENHNINIEGSKNKKELRNIGYYHGYKGYRYINSPNNKINIQNFDELVAIVDFDSKLKSLFYPFIMQIETISKNIVLQLLVEEYKTDEFKKIFDYGMIDYKNSSDPKIYKKKMSKRLMVQNNILSTISHSYNNNNKIVEHFYSQGKKIPIWGIFEIITLGVFADFINCLDINFRKKIAKEMKINLSFDKNIEFPQKIMYLIKSLRNSIAHNDVIFDVRFKDAKIDKSLCKYIENEINCSKIDFNTITDYVIIIVLILKKYGLTKTEINKFINDYEKTIEDFRNKIPYNIYSQIIHTDTRQNLNLLRNYVKMK